MKVIRKTLRKIALVSIAVTIALLVISLLLFGSSPNIDYLLIVIFAVGVAPTTFASIVHNRWKNKILRAMPEFLRDLGASIQTGVPIQPALENAASRNYGPLTIELKIMLSNMSWGMSFEDAMMKLDERIDLPLVKNAIVLILEASRHGGDLFNIFNSTSEYMKNINTWTMKRKSQTNPYVMIFYFSVVIFLFIIILISKLIFMPIGELSATGAPMLNPLFSPEEGRRVFLHAALLEAIFGGMIAGKINEASFISGLKHSMLLSIVTGVAFFVLF